MRPESVPTYRDIAHKRTNSDERSMAISLLEGQLEEGEYATSILFTLNCSHQGRLRSLLLKSQTGVNVIDAYFQGLGVLYCQSPVKLTKHQLVGALSTR